MERCTMYVFCTYFFCSVFFYIWSFLQDTPAGALFRPLGLQLFFWTFRLCQLLSYICVLHFSRQTMKIKGTPMWLLCEVWEPSAFEVIVKVHCGHLEIGKHSLKLFVWSTEQLDIQKRTALTTQGHLFLLLLKNLLFPVEYEKFSIWALVINFW